MNRLPIPIHIGTSLLLSLLVTKKHLLYKDKMLSVCLSVSTFWHARSFAVSPRIRAKFARNEAPILGEHGVHFKMVLIHVVHHLQRFECQGVDDSC